ncbi:hypothetical protein CRENBAI_002020, partial [Crenichthys baileyi]
MLGNIEKEIKAAKQERQAKTSPLDGLLVDRWCRKMTGQTAQKARTPPPLPSNHTEDFDSPAPTNSEAKSLVSTSKRQT